MAEFVFGDEVPVPEDALEYFRTKGLRLSWDHREVYREEHDLAFSVAKVACIDLLSDIRKHVEQALAEGRPLQQFQRELQPVLEKKGWWGEAPNPDDPDKPIQLGSPRRLKTIFDANMRTARAAGQWERAQRTKRARPYFIYELGPSAKHRPEHQDWEGTVVPVDDPWLDAHYPPNGWGCKCRLRQISRAEAERRGMKAPPPPSYVDWQNERTGETVRVPRGIDPGWDRNPGKTRHVEGASDPNAPVLRRRMGAGPHIPVAHDTDYERNKHVDGTAAKRGARRKGAWIFDPGVDTNQLAVEILRKGEFKGSDKDVGILKESSPSGALNWFRWALELGDREIGSFWKEGMAQKRLSKVEIKAAVSEGKITYHLLPRDPATEGAWQRQNG